MTTKSSDKGEKRLIIINMNHTAESPWKQVKVISPQGQGLEFHLPASSKNHFGFMLAWTIFYHRISAWVSLMQCFQTCLVSLVSHGFIRPNHIPLKCHHFLCSQCVSLDQRTHLQGLYFFSIQGNTMVMQLHLCFDTCRALNLSQLPFRFHNFGRLRLRFCT